MKTILVVTGSDGIGKSSAAVEALEVMSEVGYTVRLFSFADKIRREMLEEWVGKTDEPIADVLHGALGLEGEPDMDFIRNNHHDAVTTLIDALSGLAALPPSEFEKFATQDIEPGRVFRVMLFFGLKNIEGANIRNKMIARATEMRAKHDRVFANEVLGVEDVDLLVIDDLRHKVEVEAVERLAKERGAKLINLHITGGGRSSGGDGQCVGPEGIEDSAKGAEWVVEHIVGIRERA